MCGFQRYQRRPSQRSDGPERERQYAGGPSSVAADAVADGGRQTTNWASGSANYRVSAAERDAVIDDLRQHTADGRLTLDEFGERTEQALAARTGAELRSVLRELPRLRSSHQRSLSSPLAGAQDRLRLPFPVMLTAVIALLGVVSGHWWVIFPLMWFGGSLFRPRQHDHHHRQLVDDAG